MSKYPFNSTAKMYKDADGNDVTLTQLIRRDPNWAYSRIKRAEEAEAKLKEVPDRIEHLYDHMSVGMTANGQHVHSQVVREILKQVADWFRSSEQSQEEDVCTYPDCRCPVDLLGVINGCILIKKHSEQSQEGE